MKRSGISPFSGALAVLLALHGAEASTDKPVLAVFNVEDRGVGLTNKLLLRLSDYLAMQLAATGAYQLVPRDQLKQRYEPDFICYEKIIFEIKAVSALTDEHRAQVQNYLRATGYRLGLLVNFGHHPLVEAERIAL